MNTPFSIGRMFIAFAGFWVIIVLSNIAADMKRIADAQMRANVACTIHQQ